MDTKRSAADHVYEYVRLAILSRRFVDNELLGEGRLASETGVSRTPVREALLRLESDGMVQLLPKRGALVLPVTAREWRDVLDTRELVESHCAQVILRRGAGAGLRTVLNAALVKARAAADSLDLAGYVTADRDFHAAIVAAAGNDILIRLYRTLRDRQLRMGVANLLAEGGTIDGRRMERTISEHRAIADALAIGDLDETIRLISDHLATAARTLA